LTTALLACLVLPGVTVEADDWSQYRGPERSGVSQETGLLDSWPETGPEELWRRQIGIGYSAISVAGEQLYTMYTVAQEEKEVEVVAACAAATGEQLWSTNVGEAMVSDWGNGPRSTPTVVGDTVYALGSRGNLVALATADGSLRWQISLVELGGRQPYHGFSASPLVEGDTLIIESGGPEGKSFVGLDRTTGETRWSTGEVSPPGYNSALPVDLHGQHQILYLVVGKLISLSSTGEELWSYPIPRGEAHGMPLLIAPDQVFISGAEGIGAHLLRVKQEEDSLSAEEVWQSRAMRSHFSSCVYHDGHIYGFDIATLRCISVATGEPVWKRRGLGKGSLILVDGSLIVLSDKGRLLLVEASPSGFQVRGQVQALEGRSWTAPTIAKGRLYLRNHTEMVSYSIKG
jgi:outer membrane protein assembly factor BamB